MMNIKNQKLFQVKAGDIVWVDYGNCADASHDGDATVQDNRQKGVRPAIILSNAACCESSPVVISCPLTGKIHKKLPVHLLLNSSALRKPSFILPEQLCAINRYQIRGKLGELSDSEMSMVKTAVQHQLFG